MLYLVLKSVWYKPYNCPQKKEFCRLFLQKEMTEFWHQECWQIAESAARLSLDWQFNHRKCTARLGSEGKKRRTYSFPKHWKMNWNLKCKHFFFFFFLILLRDLCAMFSGVVLSISTYILISSERPSVNSSHLFISALIVWCQFGFSFNFLIIKVVFKFGTCCVKKIIFVQGMNSACYSCCNLSTCSVLVFRTPSREIVIHWSSEM